MSLEMWKGKPHRRSQCAAGETCFACERLGYHLEPYEYSPADRLDALDKVAQAARTYRDSVDDPNLEATWQALLGALHELDQIEAHQGRGMPIVNAAKPPYGEGAS